MDAFIEISAALSICGCANGGFGIVAANPRIAAMQQLEGEKGANKQHLTCTVAATSAPNPFVIGASWAMTTRPVFFADCNTREQRAYILRSA